MVVVLSRYAKVQFCPSKMFRTPVTPHETNLLLSEITVWQLPLSFITFGVRMFLDFLDSFILFMDNFF